MTAEARPGVIDLRPLLAPASIAVVGASPRSWIAETVRDNLRVMGSATRCHFVNPKYEELHGQPCYPSLEALPETPDIAIVTNNCEVSSVYDPTTNGTRTLQAIATFVIQKERGTWRIVSARPMVPVVAPPKSK